MIFITACRSVRRDARLLCYSTVLVAMLLGGCGVQIGPGLGSGIGSDADTTITILTSSTANDQLSQFQVQLTGLALTMRGGKHVEVLGSSGSNPAEFIHVNGGAEPLATASIPQGVYTSATATVGISNFTCVSLNSSGGITYATFPSSAVSSSSVTVNVPTEITVTGATMALLLNMQISQSASWSTCDGLGDAPYSISPTFDLTAIDSATPYDGVNGLDGLVTAVDHTGNAITVAGADGPVWHLNVSGSTTYEGIDGISAVNIGMPIYADVEVQPDGSFLATQISVVDANMSNLTVTSGPLTFISDSIPAIQTVAREAQGHLYPSGAPLPPIAVYSVGNASFRISPLISNVSGLPFTARFNAMDMVPGQSVLITSHALVIAPEPTYIPATTITLLPQTIDGTVSAVSSDGGFDTYTVTLAPYDLFPALAVQAGQTNLLTQPNTVVVYVGNDTQLLNTMSLAVGSVLRFNGLIFNDQGTLRMDCAWVRNGVPE